MAAPAQQSTPAVESPSAQPVEPRELTMDDMLRECIELCAQVAEKHAAVEAAQHIRRLKPPSRWP